jgi:nicotinamide riboside transporter PnuC
MTELLGTIATVIAVAGVVANNRKWRICFWLWLVSNGLTAAIHAQTGIWSLCVRDIIFFGLAVEGLWLWKKQPLKGEPK